MIVHLYLLPLYIASLIILSIYIVERKIKRNYTNASFETLLDALSVIVNTEIIVYEHSLFKTKETITNSNYENFYKDICNAIFKSMSEDLYEQLSHYITKEGIAEIVCQHVQDYLQSKVNLVFKKDNQRVE